MQHTGIKRTAVAAVAALGMALGALGGVVPAHADNPGIRPTVTAGGVIQPAPHLTQGQASALQSQLQSYVDEASYNLGSGFKLIVKNVVITGYDGTQVFVKFDLRIKKTTFPEASTSGDARGRFKLQLTSTGACISDLSITDLNLHNVPNWIDNTVVRDALNHHLPNQICVP